MTDLTICILDDGVPSVMRPSISFVAGVCALTLFVSGCGSNAEAIRQMSDTPAPPAIPRSPAIDKIYIDPLGMQRVYMLMDNDDVSSVKSFVATADFKERVKNFADEPIPANAVSPEREESKKKVVKIMQDLCEAGKKKVPDAEFKKILDQVQPAWAEFLKPL